MNRVWSAASFKPDEECRGQSAAIVPSVVLASLPWAPVTEPSLAIGILAAKLRALGIRARALHLNIDLLDLVTFDTYVKVAEYWGLNEFVFTEGFSPDVDDKQLDALIDRCAEHLSDERTAERYGTVEQLLDMLLRFRMDVVPAYLARCADRVLAEQPTLLGLTCMFDQTLASVALAKIVKERSPDVMIVLGGYALQGPPGEEVLNAFPWIDAIARGDGEDLIGKLADASVGLLPLEQIDNLLVRGTAPRPIRNANIQQSPDPDYTDWFADVARLEREAAVKVVTGTLPVESSRGCWWGQHSHCVFCGIDDDTLKFRHKSPERALEMLARMRERYGEYEFRFSDYILPKPYFDEVLPALSRQRPRFRLKCEIKANQSVDRVRALANAGFTEVQPGIESFSSAVLRLMDKGVSSIDNVALIKQGYINGIVIHYNFLYGIPGETVENYREMRSNIPRLYHLTPPVSRSEAIVTRYAPLQSDPGRFGYQRNAVHHRCYDVLFSAAAQSAMSIDLDNYCYYFERYEPFADEMLEVYGQCVDQINAWKAHHREREVGLDYVDDGRTLTIRDSRYGLAETFTLGGTARQTYLACDKAPIRINRLAQAMGNIASAAQIDEDLRQLNERRLIWCDEERVLGLATPREVAESHFASRWRDQWVSIYR